MEKRTIIHIDEDKCNGCGLCATACAEGAIQMVDGKAKLVSDAYCDGLGACLAPCPVGALSLITRDAEAFDEEAARRHVEASRNATAQPSAAASAPSAAPPLACGCPGGMARSIKPARAEACSCGCESAAAEPGGPLPSELANWPVQLMLLSPQAPYLRGADLLLAADCAAFAHGDFHRRIIKGKQVAIACPKLDDMEPRIARLADIITQAKIKSLTVARMEVPCCGGLERIAREAIRRSGLAIPLSVVTIGINGAVLEGAPAA